MDITKEAIERYLQEG